MMPVFLTRAWDYDYALAADTYNTQFADKSNCKKPCHTCRPYLGQQVPDFSSMQLWLRVIFGYSYKHIDHQILGWFIKILAVYSTIP